MNTQLPDKCPTCGAAKNFHLSLQYGKTESADYECGLSLHMYRDHDRKPDVRNRCASDPIEVKEQQRRDVIDTAVAKALNKVKATHEECRRFVARMESAKWGSRPAGIWLLLPPEEKET